MDGKTAPPAPPEHQEHRPPAFPLPLLVALLFLLAVLPFLPALNNGFVYDDDLYITLNRAISSGLTPAAVRWAFSTTYASNWHPLTWLSHILDIQLFGLTIQVIPGNYLAHYNLSVTLQQKGETEAAIRNLRTTVELQPGYASAHFNLSLALADHGRYGEAEQDGRPAEARVEYAEALRLSPGMPESAAGLRRTSRSR